MKNEFNSNQTLEKTYQQSDDSSTDINTHPRLYKSHSRKLNFENESMKHALREIYPMFDNTFIILKKNILFHIDENGKILDSLGMDYQIKKILPMTEDSLLIFQHFRQQIKAFKITQWDIKTSQTIDMYHYNTKYQSHQFFGFNQTKVFCVVEKQFERDLQTIYSQGSRYPNCFWQQEQQVLDSVEVCYYHFPLKKDGNNFLDIKCFKRNQQNCPKVFKLDSHSKIGIIGTKLNNKKQTLLKEVSLGCRTWSTIPIKFGKQLKYDEKWFQPVITQAYEYKKGHYYLKVQAKASRIQYLFNKNNCNIQTDLQELQQSFSFSWNLKTNQMNNLINNNDRHQVQFTQSFREVEIIRFIKRRSFQKRCEVYEIPIRQTVIDYEILPVYYIDNTTASIIYVQSNSNHKYYPLYAPNEAIQLKLEPQSISYCRYKALLSLIPQLNYTYFVTQYIGKDIVDEKLVTDVVQLLEGSDEDKIIWTELFYN